jgi:hypothetical protein
MTTEVKVYAGGTLADAIDHHRKDLVFNAFDALSLINEQGLKRCLMTCGVPSRLVGAIEDIENFLLVHYPEVLELEVDDEYEGEGVETHEDADDEPENVGSDE